jgi:hypothetical protein
MARAFHDRLGPQLNPWVIPLAERAFAVAAEDLADRAKAHSAKGLSVSAAPDVEIEHSGLIGDDIDCQRVVLRPQGRDRP